MIGDALRLRSAVENLIDNAVKFTERGTVRLDVIAETLPRGRVRLTFTITDSGLGIAPAELKRLFRPFAQANTAIGRRYGGAGLGLAYVKRLAKAMGGDLAVTSKRGQGSCFRLSVVAEVAEAAGAAFDDGDSRLARRPARWRSCASRTIRMAAWCSTPS